MIEEKGYNIILKAEINGTQKLFAGTTFNDVALNFMLQRIKTKADGQTERYKSNGYSLNLTINGLISINQTTGEKAANLDRNDVVALAMLQAPFKFYYTLGGKVWTGEIIIADYTEATGADGTANYSVKCKLSGELIIYSGVYQLNNIQQPDILLGLDTTTTATANITATEGGNAYLKFVWDFGNGQTAEIKKTYEFETGQTREITESAPLPAELVPGNYTLTISGVLSAMVGFGAYASDTLNLSLNSAIAFYSDDVTITDFTAHGTAELIIENNKLKCTKAGTVYFVSINGGTYLLPCAELAGYTLHDVRNAERLIVNNHTWQQKTVGYNQKYGYTLLVGTGVHVPYSENNTKIFDL